MIIPKKIHYIWIGPNPIPELTKKCIASWRKYCPDYEIILWNESNLALQDNLFSFEAYKEKVWGIATDYFRLKIVYEQGGIYLDTDVELVKSLDDLIKQKGFFGFESKEFISTGIGFACEAYNPILLDLMQSYENVSFFNQDGSYDLTPCTHKDTKVFLKYGVRLNNTYQIIHGIHILPKDYFCPLDYATGNIEITANTYAIHHYMASWHTSRERTNQKIRRRLCELFGKSLGDKIARYIIAYKNHDLLTLFKKIKQKLV